MIAEIGSALTGLKVAGDLAALVLKIKVDASVTEKAIESQSAIINAQSAMLELQSKHQELLDSNNALKQQLIEIDDWNAETGKYLLTDLESGIFVYSLSSDEQATTPEHWLCTRCYQDKQKSILVRTGADSKGIIFLCFRCQNSIRTHRTPGKSNDSIPV